VEVTVVPVENHKKVVVKVHHIMLY
jgi:hypothetical protein